MAHCHSAGLQLLMLTFSFLHCKESTYKTPQLALEKLRTGSSTDRLLRGPLNRVRCYTMILKTGGESNLQQVQVFLA